MCRFRFGIRRLSCGNNGIIFGSDEMVCGKIKLMPGKIHPDYGMDELNAVKACLLFVFNGLMFGRT